MTCWERHSLAGGISRVIHPRRRKKEKNKGQLGEVCLCIMLGIAITEMHLNSVVVALWSPLCPPVCSQEATCITQGTLPILLGTVAVQIGGQGRIRMLHEMNPMILHIFSQTMGTLDHGYTFLMRRCAVLRVHLPAITACWCITHPKLLARLIQRRRRAAAQQLPS